MPLPHDPAMRAVLDPYAAEILEFNFAVKRLNGAGPLPAGPHLLRHPALSRSPTEGPRSALRAPLVH